MQVDSHLSHVLRCCGHGKIQMCATCKAWRNDLGEVAAERRIWVCESGEKPSLNAESGGTMCELH